MKNLLRYWIIQGTIAVLCIGLTGFFIYQKVSKSLLEDARENYEYSNLLQIGVILAFLALIGIFIYFWIDHVHIVKYHELTGRKLSQDRQNYERKYNDLVDYFENADPYKLDIEQYDIKPWYKSKGVILGTVNGHLIERKASDKGSILVAGLPGDGKTTGIVIPTATRFGGSVMAVDIKGDILTAVRKIAPNRKMAVFNPDNPKGFHFDPFEGIDKMNLTQVEVLITNMAQILVPDEESKDSKFFVDGARAFFIGIFFFFWERDKNVPFMSFINAILENNFSAWLKSVNEHGGDTSRKYIVAFIGANDNNTGGQYSKLTESLRKLTLGALPELLNKEGKKICPQMLQKGIDVYIHIPQDLIKEYSVITTLICSSFMRYWMRLTDNTIRKPRPTIMILDEFAQMHFQADLITGALATLRSKGVTLMIIVQSLEMLKKNYGEHDANTIVENCGLKCVLSAAHPQSQEFFSKLFGKKRVLKVNTTRGEQKKYTKSISEAEEEIIKPSAFGALNKIGDGGKVAIQIDGYYTLADKCFWFKDFPKKSKT